MEAILVGVSGKAGHGKDSLANILLEKFATMSILNRIYFADQLKKTVQEVFMLEHRHLWDEEGKDEQIKHLGGITGRSILQNFGEAVRKIYGDMWVIHYERVLFDFIYKYKASDRMLIVTPDVRHKNEYDCIKKNVLGNSRGLYGTGHNINLKSMLIRVIRPGHVMNGDASHASETSLDDINGWDHIVVANDLAQLSIAADPIIDDINKHFKL